ncbi:MAG: glycosyltransferase family 39 protein [bacterium]|nr:glycosyltransferase family 39 protein [bacterium]
MKRAVTLAFLVLIAAKWATAARLDLFADEAFYWQCGQRPAIAYVDHPPVTAMLVRAGTELLGVTPLGVRFFFLLLGTAFPFLVFHLARPLVGGRDAWWAAGTTLVVPAFAHLGLLAIPDAAMLPLTAVFLAALERATREGATRFWLLAGLAGAFGLATHYRFVLTPIAALLYLVVTRRGRRHWRSRGPWLLFLVLAPGLAPALAVNLRSNLEPVRYYLAGRHGGGFQAGAWPEFLAGQALLLTPLLFVALIATLVVLCRRALGGDDRAILLSLFALSHIGVFFLASPFENSDLITVHWPVAGYLALVPHLPRVLRDFASVGGRWRRVAAVLTPALGAVVTGLILIELATGWLRLGAVREPFIGWSEVAAQSRVHLPELDPAPSGRWVIVADNYKLGAQLERELHDRADVYVLDHHKNRAHGRAPQLVVWGIDEQGLGRRAGDEALVVVEWSQIRTDQHDAWLAHVGSFFEALEPLGELRVESTGKRKKFKLYRFYRGRVADRHAQRPAEPATGAG